MLRIAWRASMGTSELAELMHRQIPLPGFGCMLLSDVALAYLCSAYTAFGAPGETGFPSLIQIPARFPGVRW